MEKPNGKASVNGSQDRILRATAQGIEPILQQTLRLMTAIVTQLEPDGKGQPVNETATRLAMAAAYMDRAMAAAAKAVGDPALYFDPVRKLRTAAHPEVCALIEAVLVLIDSTRALLPRIENDPRETASPAEIV